MNDKPKHYLTPQDFFDETLNSLRVGRVSNKLAKMFFTLCEKYVNHPNFVRYHHIRDDLVSCAVLACVKGFGNFRPYRNMVIRDDQDRIISSTKVEWDGGELEYDYRTCNNPFAYFTSCAHNDILQFLKQEYKQRNVINKTKVDNGLDADEGYVEMIRNQETSKRLGEDRQLEEVEVTVVSMIEWEDD